jgi:hypothetical protein
MMMGFLLHLARIEHRRNKVQYTISRRDIEVFGRDVNAEHAELPISDAGEGNRRGGLVSYMSLGGATHDIQIETMQANLFDVHRE